MSPKTSKASLKASVSPTDASPSTGSKSKSQMHRRSRTGCFTCRLRRKKCDEAKPACKACRHLCLSCEYKRPNWWSNSEHRRKQKEHIKDMIKNTKQTEKQQQQQQPSSTNLSSANTPPSLCFSLPTSESQAESLMRAHGASPESQFSPPFFDTPQDYFNSTPMPPPGWTPLHHQYPQFSPFEVDVKTERQMYINDVPTRRDSTISTFSTFQPPPTPHGSITSVPPTSWVHQEYFESQSESFTEEPLDFNFFNFPHDSVTPSHQGFIQVEDCDRYLLDHFFNNVLPLVFPILEINQHGSARTNVILPALEQNKCYLHCCLSASALHFKATKHIEDGDIDGDIMRHRGNTISTFCETLANDIDHPRMLEATLAMIFLQSAVGSPFDDLPDIPWHQHFQAAADLVNRLELSRSLVELSYSRTPHGQPPFDMTLAAWIDILGATMMGRVPLFADTYRLKNETSTSSGLAELMGCEDRIMYLISEIACLEALKLEGMDDLSVCNIIKQLGEHLSNFDPGTSELAPVYATGSAAIRPRQLSKNMTAVFRLAARIYLCALVPDFDRHASSITNLTEALARAMDYIPAGADGFDRSLVWPLLIAGSVSLEKSSFRTMFYDRSAKLGEGAKFGSFGRVAELLSDVWAINDEADVKGEKKSVHWRDVMQQKGCDFLLI